MISNVLRYSHRYSKLFKLGKIRTILLGGILILYSLCGIAAEKDSVENHNATTNQSISLEKMAFLDQLTQSERDWLRLHPLIRVSSESDYAPFDFQVDGQPAGYSIDLVKLIASRLGIEVEFVKGDFAELIEKTRRHEVDLMHTVFRYPKERENFLDFTRSYKNSVNGIVTREDDTQILGINDLIGKRVAVVKGDATARLIEKQYPEIIRVEVVNYQEALKTVAFAKADATVTELPVFHFLTRQLFLNNLKVAAELDIDIDYSYRFAVRKDWPELKAIWSKAMDSLTSQQLNLLDDRWLNATSSQQQQVTLTEEERNWLSKHPVIRVQNEIEFFPYNFNDGIAKGYSVDYMKLLGKKLGIRFEFIEGPSWQEFIDMIQRGQLDVMVNIVATEPRQRFLNFTKNYQQLSEGIFVKQGKPRFQSLNELKGKRIAVVEGYYQNELLRQYYPDIQQVPVKNNFSAIEAVLTDKADVFLSDTALVNYIKRQRAIGGIELSSITKDSRFQNSFSLGVRRDWPELRFILQKAMDAVSDNELRDLGQTWLADSPANTWRFENLNSEELDWLTTHQQIKVANELDFVPLNFNVQGKAQGFAIDYLNLLTDRIGIKVEYINGPDWNGFMSMIREEEIDVIPNVIHTERREKYIEFTSDYLDSYFSFFTKVGAAKIESLEQLKGKRLAIVEGFFDQELLATYYPEIKLVLLKNIDETLLAVLNGSADATIADPAAVSVIMEKLKVDGLEQTGVVTDDRFTNISAIGVAKDKVVLRNILQKAMEDINYLEVQKLLRKWYPDTLGKAVSNEIRQPSIATKTSKSEQLLELFAWQNLATLGLTIVLVIGVVLLLIRLLERSRKDPLAYQFASFRGKQIAVLFNALLIMSTLILVWWTLQNIKTKIKEDLKDTLKTVVNTTLEAMNIWVSDQKNQLQSLASDPRIVELARQQNLLYLQGADLQTSSHLLKLRQLMKKNQRTSEDIGFFVVAKDGTNIASMRDNNIGLSNLILKQRPGLFRRVLNGESLLVPPLESDVPLKDAKNIANLDRPPTMFFATPLFDEKGEVFAVLTRRLDPHAEFTRIHQLGRLGNTGETYSFDRQGKLLSDSRFSDQLITAGILKPDEQSILSLEIRDPGGNLLHGFHSQEQSQRKLTLMAESAINHGEGFNVDGYRDYRGVPVFGAWLWDEKLGIGIATEVDQDEAMEAYASARLVIVITMVFTVSISIIFTLFTVILGSRANRVLHDAREQLELSVQKRTKELERALKNLAEEEQKLQVVVDNFPGPLSLKSSDGRYQLINSMGEEFLGVSKAEAIGKTDMELFPPHVAQFILSKDRAAIESGKQIQYEQQLPSRDGKLHDVLTTKIAIVSEDKKDIELIAVALDISERKKAERALHQALRDLDEQRFVLDQHAMVTITDLNGIITYANQKFIDISGYHADELIGQNHRILNSGVHDNEFWQSMYQTLEQAGVWHNEVCNRTKDGNYYWVDSTVAAFKGEDGKPKAYVAIRTDISERKLYEKELRKSKEQAEAANRAKSEFLASMSHEIRTPLNGVLGMLGLMQRSSLTTEQKHRISIAKSSAQALLGLINDILDFSKIEAGKLDLEELDFDLRALLEEVAHTQIFRCEEKGINLLLDTTGIYQTMVRGDPGRIRQVLLNLLGNAIKFTDSGEIIITAKLIEQNRHELQFNCRIQDTGIGIPQNRLDNLFESFTQVDASTTRKYGGTGLGLAICKKLCEIMQGDIKVVSEEGQGSCFEFNVTFRPSEHAVKVIPQTDISQLNILIADANTKSRKILRHQLKAWGGKVSEAADGLTALALCEAQEIMVFDIALVEMQLPQLNGAELTQKLRSDIRYKDMKIIMMTSLPQTQHMKQLLKLGLDGFCSKPLSTSDLFNALNLVKTKDKSDAKTLTQTSTLTDSATETSTQQMVTMAESEDKPLWPDKPRILLVEDNQVNQYVAQGMLRDLGLDCDTVYNGVDAIARLTESAENNAYDLILMDCQMPVLDGYQATQQIREGKAGERYRTVVIVAMTANAMLGDRQKCLDAGMDDYIAKPVEELELQETLYNWLVRKVNSKQPLLNEPPIIETAPIVSEKKMKADETSDQNEATGEKRQVDPPNQQQEKSLAEKSPSANQTRESLLIPSGLHTIDFVNKKPGIASLPTIYLRALSLYSSQALINLQELQLSFNAGDMLSLKNIIHALKGSSGNMGMDKVYQLAIQLEKQIAQSNSIETADFERFNELIQLSIEDARAIQAANQCEVMVPGAREYPFVVDELLSLLQGSMLVPDNLVEEYKQSALRVKPEAFVSQVYQALVNFDYAKAFDLLQNND